jgi:hypothetical protein
MSPLRRAQSELVRVATLRNAELRSAIAGAAPWPLAQMRAGYRSTLQRRAGTDANAGFVRKRKEKPLSSNRAIRLFAAGPVDPEELRRSRT